MEPYSGDPAITEDHLYTMADAANAGRFRDLGKARERWFRWGHIPKSANRARILKLCLCSDDLAMDTVPEVVRDLPNLLWLEIPTRFVPKLTAEAIPPSTQTLRITGDAKLTLPRTLHLAGICRLEVVGNCTLKFRAAQIPAIRHLGLKLDIQGDVLRQVAHIRDLEALRAGPIRSQADLETLVRLPLRFFKPVGGKLDTIAPLRDCPSLTHLWLSGLSRLTSVAPLNDLPRLTDLAITHCCRVQFDPSFVHLPAIRRLTLDVNRASGLHALRPALRARGLESFRG